MALSFLHGAEVIQLDGGPRPIRTVNSAVIGLVGTAPLADATAFPLDTPVLIAGNRTEAAKLGPIGTLPQAIDGIFDQVGALVVVIRVAEAIDNMTVANIIGGVDAITGAYTGSMALLAAESVLGLAPRILIAPGFTAQAAVLTNFVAIAEKLRAVVIADGPNTNDAAAMTAATNSGSKRVYMVDPDSRVFDTVTATEIIQPSSSRVAGLIAKMDTDKGFWWSPSNQEINGIIGTSRAVDFTLGDTTSRANQLNAGNVATIIHKNGYRLWGNRTLSADPKWAFLSVVRTADMINDSLLRAHMWAVDRNITKSYIEDVTAGVNNYLRDLKAQGAILGGECWADPELNTPSQIADGKVFFDFDFTPPTPAEHITFRSHLVNDYIKEVI